MEDIEDAFQDESTPIQRQFNSHVAVKRFKAKEKRFEANELQQDHFLPGNAKVFVKTWGCGHNNSDGEYMAGMLAANGYSVILDHDRQNDADVWLLNSCTVKGPSQQTFVNDIEKGRKAGKKVVVAGCVPQGSQQGAQWKDLSVIGVQQIDQVVSVVEETLKGNIIKLMREAKDVQDGKKRKAGGAPLDLPKIRRNPYIEIIPINTGCLNQCTYCKTKHARGDLGSYSPAEIVARVKSVLDEGVKEIWLTSEDTGAYGRDIGADIVQLLDMIVDAMDAHKNAEAMLRVGMTNPPYILEHLEGICRILNHPRVYSFLHVPVQAGSTKVLEDMRRLYTIQDFERVVDVLRDNVPDVTVATDVICGFPTETEEDFDKTLAIIDKYRFSVLHISQFYPRPGTPAARMQPLTHDVVKSRSRRVTALFDSYTTYDKLMGTTQTVLVTDQSADGKYYVAHNKAYHQVLLPKDPRIMGRQVKAKINRVGKFFIGGDVCEEEIQSLVSEADPLHLVSINRIPKLVRLNNRGMVAVSTQDATNTHNERDDGAILSLGSRLRSVAAESRILQSPIRYSAYISSFMAIALWHMYAPNLRWSFKLGMFALLSVVTEWSIDSYIDFTKNPKTSKE